MIPIKKTSPEKVKEFCEKIYNKLSENVKKELNTYVKENIKELEGADNSFLQVMTADYEFLKKYKSVGERLPENLAKSLKEKYGSISSKERKEIIDLKDVTVCPYCNRNYIYSTFRCLHCNECDIDNFLESDSDKKCTKCGKTIRGDGSGKIKVVNTAQLDHFFSKNEYPLFTLSFYNLVPSCYSCNHVKSTSELKYSPYDEEFDFEEVKFTYTHESMDRLKIRVNSSTEFQKNIKTLGIEELYQGHIDIVEELIQKKEIYGENYKNGLQEIFDKANVSMTKSEMNRLITGAYTTSEDYGKRPLSKMITEISEEIGLIGENE